MNQMLNPTISQSVSRAINQSINQSINHSTDQITQCLNKAFCFRTIQSNTLKKQNKKNKEQKETTSQNTGRSRANVRYLHTLVRPYLFEQFATPIKNFKTKKIRFTSLVLLCFSHRDASL